MAHTILGIDLGTYSVKLAQLQAGFRTMRLLSLHERTLLPPLTIDQPEAVSPGAAGAIPPKGEGEGESLLDRQFRTLVQMVSELNQRPEMTAVSLAEESTVRVIALPLSDPKKVEQVLPFELEGQLMGELEDQVIDHTVARTGLLPDGQTASAASPEAQGSLLVAAAAPKARVQELVARLERLGLEPRLVGAAALSEAALLSNAPLPEGPTAILDLGHRTSQFCVVERRGGKDARPSATFARTIGRGGHHLSVALSRALSLDLAMAETRKCELGQVDPTLVPSLSGEAAHVATALLEGIRPLLRDLRQTLASYATLYGAVPRTLFLAGGGARLRGVDRLLSAELDLEVVPLSAERLAGSPWMRPSTPEGSVDPALGPAIADLDQQLLPCAAALGLALSVASPAPQVNFRKGELAFRTDYSFLRERAPHLMVAVFAILVCAGLSTLASLRNLQRENDQLTAVLRAETTQLFNEPKTDGNAVSAELAAVLSSQKGGGQSVPTTSAFDLLDEISRIAPPGGTGPGGGLDVSELNIRSKKTDLRATAGTAQYEDDLVAALSKIACFKDIEKGKVVSVRNTGADGKPIEVKQFSLAITTTCP